MTNLEKRWLEETGKNLQVMAELDEKSNKNKTLRNRNDILSKEVQMSDKTISDLRKTRSAAEQRSNSLAEELTEAKQELSQEKKNHTLYREDTEKKLISAKELWRCHKELIELHFKDKDEDAKKPILEALVKEFGTFQDER
jgi:septal ring factor EnvC (AmiA/AmiB activator)